MEQILHAVSVLLASALLALVFMGLFIKEVSCTATVRIKAPIDDVWSTFMDLDQRKLWQKNLEWINVNPDQPISTGSSLHMNFLISRVRTKIPCDV